MVYGVGLRENLRGLLDERGWSAYELAQRAGVQANHIGHVLTGRIQMPRGTTLVKIARELGVSTEALISEQYPSGGGSGSVVREGDSMFGGLPHEFHNGADVFAVPLVALDVAAGTPQLRMYPDEPRPYYFRIDFLKRKGWTRGAPDRLAIYKLGDDTVARSMEDKISAGSLLLVDMQPEREHVPARSVWIVNLGGAPILKYVTWQPPYFVLESHNREDEPAFAPRVVKAASKAERTTLLEGRVVWYATEIA